MKKEVIIKNISKVMIEEGSVLFIEQNQVDNKTAKIMAEIKLGKVE